MTCTKAYKEHIMYTFHGYCKVVIRYAAINAWRDRSRKYKREVSLEYLTEEKFYPLGTTDEYFEAPYEEYPITHRGKCMDAAGVRPGIKSAEHYNFCITKWRCFHMGNPNLIPYETVVRATSGEPEAVDEVLQFYSHRIRRAALENGHINKDTEDSIKSRLVTALFKVRFDEQAK